MAKFEPSKLLLGTPVNTQPRGRHHMAPHHWSSIYLLAAVAVGLLVLLVITANHNATPLFKASTKTVSSQASSVLTGVTSDLSNITTTDLSDSILQP
jgi:hypothetical protein